MHVGGDLRNQIQFKVEVKISEALEFTARIFIGIFNYTNYILNHLETKSSFSNEKRKQIN